MNDLSPTIYDQETNKSMNYIQQINKDSLRDRVFGLLIGSFIGDSCGSCIDTVRYMPNEA